jgi:hypothetical protein
MIAVISLTLVLASATVMAPSPPCWVREDPADLELRISRLDSATTTLGQDTLTVCYSRPRVLGRPIMGRVVPFGEPWRLGANEATTLTVSAPVLFGDLRLLPGSYSLYAVPERREWRLIVNGVVRRWGIPIDGTVRAQDLGATTAPVEELTESVEEFRIRFEPTGRDAVNLVIEWDRTRVRVPIRRAPA